MRSPRLLTFALVRDTRLPHLLRSLLSEVWQSLPNARRRLIIATCYEELCEIERGDEVEAVLVEVRDVSDVLRLAGATDAAPDARVVAVPSSLLLTPLAGEATGFADVGGEGITVLESLDEAGLRVAFGAHWMDRAV